MERAIKKQTIGALAFIFACALAVAFAPQAHAATQVSDLQAASLVTQAVDDNTSKEQARILTSGTTAVGKFYHVEGTSSSTIEDYWYKFKTSKRDSAYALKLVSIDRDMMFVTCFDANMNEFDWGSADGTIADSTLDYLTDLEKDQWVYFRFSCTKTFQDYNKKFSITVTEYTPILEYVTGLKVAKKTGTSLTMKWKKQTSATTYQVQYRLKGGTWKTTSTAKNSVKLTGLKKNAQYQVRVRACASAGKGFYLDEHAPAKHTDWTRAVKARTAKK